MRIKTPVNRRTAIRSSNDERIWTDIQTRPAPAQLDPRAWLVLCDGGLACQRAIGRPSALWQGAFPGRLQLSRPGRIRPCTCNAAYLLVSSRGQDVYGRR